MHQRVCCTVSDANIPCVVSDRAVCVKRGAYPAGDKGLKVVISGSTGCIREWNMGGRPLLTEGVTPCFFRACIDNDRGGTGGRSYASRLVTSLLPLACTAYDVPGYICYRLSRLHLSCELVHLLLPQLGHEFSSSPQRSVAGRHAQHMQGNTSTLKGAAT